MKTSESCLKVRCRITRRNVFLLMDTAMFTLFICVTQDGWMVIFEKLRVNHMIEMLLPVASSI